LALRFDASDVAAITSGSDFQRSTLGLGLTGTGNVLFVDAGSNLLNLAGWSPVGRALVNGADYQLFQNGASVLGLLAHLRLTGTSGADVLVGYGGDDVITGGGGADTLTGGGGDDRITQTAVGGASAAGSRLAGEDGADILVFEGSLGAADSYLELSGGAGDDQIRAGVQIGQSIGAVQISGGAGDDLIRTGRIETGADGRGYLDGDAGDDRIEVLDNGTGVGVWGAADFAIRGGAGADRFVFDGVQVAVAATPQVDGGDGFDTLVWNGRYNLTVGGQQNPAVGLYDGLYAQQVQLRNVEKLDLMAAGVRGQTLRLTSEDVAAITAGSDFQRAGLGHGLTGVGATLFVDAGPNALDLSGWTSLGRVEIDGVNRQLLQAGENLLVVLANTSVTGSSASETLTGYGADDTISGGGGADILTGYEGNDRITQTAATANGAAGSRLEGGAGADTLIFDGEQAYTLNYVRLDGGDGDDLVQVGRQRQDVGSVQVEAAPAKT
jgi:Ca2+-binding RTX toxin-like protein